MGVVQRIVDTFSFRALAEFKKGAVAREQKEPVAHAGEAFEIAVQVLLAHEDCLMTTPRR